MQEYNFEAIGTKWSLLIDGSILTEELQKKILQEIEVFDKRYSRFIDSSEVNAFRNGEKGKYVISPLFLEFLQTSEKLREITNGGFDPAVTFLLEQAGYDPQYSFAEKEGIEEMQLPEWHLDGERVSIEGPIAFDFGGIGKGYAIDLVATFLKENGFQNFLVEAGGDMFATQKMDGSPFQIALEWPGKPQIAFGSIELKNQGLAVSDGFRRRWNDWHHIVDPQMKKPVRSVVGCAAVAPNAFLADCMTSGIFLAPNENFQKVREEFKGEVVAFFENEKVLISDGWNGTFF